MEQHKNNKGAYKEFYRWMVSEIEDFFPEVVSEDPLKRFYHLLDKNPLTSVTHSERKKLVVAKHPKSTKTLKHGPNFSISKYWKQFTGKASEVVIKFLDLKDIIMLIYTCKFFKEELDQESMWKILKTRDFFPLRLQRLRKDTKERVSEKLYYKYLYLSTISGIPYHSGYFKAYGSPDVTELADSIVDFLCPKTEKIRTYAGEILVRNECKTSDLKLSWLKEKNEICLWSGNASLELRKPESGNEEVETVNKFYPCFIKRYSMVDEDEEIVEVFFLEDKYLVVKLKKKVEEERMVAIFRILSLEEELHSIAKGLHPVVPFDYSFMLKDAEDSLTDIKTNEFGVSFTVYQKTKCDIKMSLLQGDMAVFYTENSVQPTLIFWDLKQKKKIDSVSLELQKPLNNIIVSKKSDVTTNDKAKLILLDEDMNVYCGSISQKEGFILNYTIILPNQAEEEKEGEEESEKPQEDSPEGLKELEAKYYLNFGKKTRVKYVVGRFPTYLPADSLYDVKKQQVDPQFDNKTRRYHHEILSKTNEEWLVVHVKNKFHFVNLDKEKIEEFSSDKDLGLLDSGNWTVYDDNLFITNPTNILHYRINFEDQTIRFLLSRQIKHLLVENVVKQWILIDPCFTVMIFTHTYALGLTARATVVVTSTQEFLYNEDPAFNLISYKAQADHFIRIPDRWEEDKYREVDMKFKNSKVLVSTEKASFYFDMTLSAEPYSKVHLNGWTSTDTIHMVKYEKQIGAEPEVAIEEEDVKATKPKMVNYMKLGGNPNTMNAKEKSNGWKKGGKSQAKKDEDKEYKVLKAKGEKFHKNIRQGQRADKMN